jgi:hypothetical protein
MTEQLVTSRMAQPPTFDLQLFDAERKVGWVSSRAIGFCGFESEEEAMHAAYLAHRTLSRRLAYRHGRRPVPVATEPLRVDDEGSLQAAGRRIATILRPRADSMAGPDSFGFELPFPEPVEEMAARSKCAHLYRTLRRSGIRWAMWRTGRTPVPAKYESKPRKPIAAYTARTPQGA